MVSTFTAVARDVAGSSANPAFVSILFCAFSISRGIASIIGPIVAAALFDYSSSDGGGGGGDFGKYGFKKITIFVGIMALLSAFGGVGLGFARKKMKTT